MEILPISSAVTYFFRMNLASAFRQTALAHADRPAIFWGETRLSYQQVLDHALRISTLLRDQFHLQPGQRVGLWLKNSPQFVFALFGVLDAGAVVVPINNFLKPDEVAFILADAQIDLVISEDEMDEGLALLRTMRPQLQVWKPNADLASVSPNQQGAQPSRSDLAVIIYTSGTTGRPKGAMLSHGNLLSNVESCRQVLSAVEADRFVVVLPMFHSFMLCVGVCLPLLIGGSMVVVRSVHPPKNVLQEIIHHGATILPCIPQFFRALAANPPTTPLPLRICLSGGAPLPAEILREFNARMPVPLLEGYGLSEASPVVSINPPAGPWKDGSIGVPIPDVEVTVQDDNGTILPPMTTGEICVRGPNVMLGYWNQPEETAKVIRGGWLLTGDIGHEDGDGYFYITDRKKDMLLVNGINVYPREIEEVLYQYPGVKEAAVIGIPDQRRGEQPIAFLSLNEGVAIKPAEVTAFVRERLADYKVPRQVHVLSALPRNATGKILKTALRSLGAGTPEPRRAQRQGAL